MFSWQLNLQNSFFEANFMTASCGMSFFSIILTSALKFKPQILLKVQKCKKLMEPAAKHLHIYLKA